MSEGQQQANESNEGGNSTGESTPGTGDEFKPITSQDELNKVLDDRLRRERSKFSDYRDLKAKAAKLDEIEQANQTEAEKAQARIKQLEDELSSAQRDSLRRKVAVEHGISDQDDIDLFLTGADEETLTKQAKRLSDRTADRKRQGNHVPREGNTSASSPNDERAAVRGLFGANG